jgi:hypothetical protein
MQINEIVNNINHNDNRGYILTETFVLNLLKVHLEKSERPILMGQRMRFDAFAPEGIGNDDYNVAVIPYSGHVPKNTKLNA